MPVVYRAGLFALAAIGAALALSLTRERRRARRAEGEARVDPLTGLANRRAFERGLRAEWERAVRYQRPLGVVMLDLDGFKRLNDTQGHAAGDRVLREAAAAMASRLRTIDLVARLGGDEFAALCPETASPGLDALAGSLGSCLEDLPVRVSIGFAERRPDDRSPAELLARADAAMYRNKRTSKTESFAVAT